LAYAVSTRSPRSSSATIACEHIDDIIADLDQALAAARATKTTRSKAMAAA
jgi:hypothetical protein